MAADGAAAFGGAAGVALAGLGEGVVLLLLVPGFHHVHDRAVPATVLQVRWISSTSEVMGERKERKAPHRGSGGEKWFGVRAHCDQAFLGKRGKDSLVASPLVLKARRLETRSALWRRSRTHIPLIEVPGREGNNVKLPK